jgi:hypothetical protein
MGANNVVRAMSLLRDEAIAEQVAGGDISPLGGLELDDAERVMVTRVAAELSAEVQGFDATSAAFEALQYVGQQGIPAKLEDELDEVVGFVFNGMAVGPKRFTPNGEGKACSSCSKCKKCGKSFTFQMPGGPGSSPFGVAPVAP